MGFIVPLPETKNGYDEILNFVDKLSKMIRPVSIVKDITAPEFSLKFKDNIYRNHGMPSKIISDCDSLYMSKFWKTLFKSLPKRIAPSIHKQPDNQKYRTKRLKK